MIPGSANSLLLASGGTGVNPRDYFDVKLYTGNGSTQTISGLGFSPDLVWIKNRTSTNDHMLQDQVRGATAWLSSNRTDAENTNTSSDWFRAFTADGFTVAYQTTGGISTNEWNASGSAYAAWCFDAGASTVSNTQGSITSQVRANPSAGFSVVTYTGTGANATVGHGLGVAPSMVIVKVRNRSGDNWLVYHKSLTTPATDYLLLSSTAAAGTLSTYWNGGPTSSVIGLGNYSAINNNSDNYVAYSFAPVAGLSAFGSYTGNGSATGPVISGLGFQPYFVMIKASSTTGDWWMYDAARSASNPRTDKLKANSSAAEDTAGEDIDFQSGGFQIKTTDSGLNQNAATYVYAAFA